MNLFDTLKGWTAAILPSNPPPKVSKGQAGEPGHRTVVGGGSARLRQQDRTPLTTNRLDVRSSQNTFSAIRTLSYSSPDMSSAVYTALRTGIPETYTVVARDMDGNINVQATQLAQELLRRIVFMGNADGSFSFQQSLQSMSESLGRELQLYGAIAGEIALDKARIPATLAPISVSQIKWYDEGKSVKPVQVVGGTEINLDLPTFIYIALDQDLLEPYSASPMESAAQPVLADIDFSNDVRRAVKRAVLPRLKATIDSDAIKKFTPPEILNDTIKFTQYKQQLIDAVQNVINGAQPEDALISFKEINYEILDGGQDPSVIIEKLQKVLNSKLQTGMKTLPVVLGHGSSSNAASTEALLFLKSANVIRTKLNEFYSKALTIAVRVMGQDCYVEFKYAELDLRPSSELEAYASMKQSRILDLLSLGMLSDEEACIMLTGNLPPKTFKPLSGTMFRAVGAGASAGAAQPGTAASPTSAMGGGDKTTPTEPKGPASSTKKKAEDEGLELQALQDSHTKSLAAVQDMAYGLVKNANRPVEVSVAPAEVHLTLAQEDKKAVKSVRIVRGEDGKVASMEVVND